MNNTALSLTHSDVDILEQWWVEKSRKNFFAFRQFMRANKFIHGWFIIDLANKLQQFYIDLLAGKRPLLIIQAPPQHGKSWSITDFIAWFIGRHPDRRIIFASFSDYLGIRTNRSIQKFMDSEKYGLIFPCVSLNKNRAVSVVGVPLKNNNMIETYQGGSFRNTTVGGPITGESLDLGVIDDPLKGREQANSQTYRTKIWDWFTDDFSTRFSELAGLIVIMTRWHIDDPVGRLIKSRPDATVINYPAIAVEDDDHRKTGEPLFPELKSIEFLENQKATMAINSWESLYQGKPVIDGGNKFKDDYWKYYTVLPKIKFRMIYADTAMKKDEQHDYSVFQCWGQSYDGKIYLLDLIRKKVEAPQLLTMARAFWNKHKAVKDLGVLRQMKPEDKASGTGLIQTLRQEGIPVKGIQRNVDKVSRANDTIPQIEVGNVYLPESAEWLSDYLSELAAFPNGKFDDQVDPTMDAIEDLLINPSSINYEDII